MNKLLNLILTADAVCIGNEFFAYESSHIESANKVTIYDLVKDKTWSFSLDDIEQANREGNSNGEWFVEGIDDNNDTSVFKMTFYSINLMD